MTDKFTASMKPRYFECDPLSQLHVAYYVRYMLQAAIEAGAAGDLGWPGMTPAEWLNRVGDIGLQIVQPASFGDSLEVQTWLSQSGPPVWRREFTIRYSATGGVAANGFVDAFDGSDGADEDSDDNDVDEPEDEPAVTATWDGPVPEPPEPPEYPFRSAWTVAWSHADISGLVDPALLSFLAGDVERRASDFVGWNAMRDQENGIVWRPIEHRLEIFEPIQPGDQLEITCYIGDVGEDDMTRHTLIERKDNNVVDLVARSRTRWACLSAETGQRTRIPDDWVLDLDSETSEAEE